MPITITISTAGHRSLGNHLENWLCVPVWTKTIHRLAISFSQTLGLRDISPTKSLRIPVARCFVCRDKRISASFIMIRAIITGGEVLSPL